MGKVKQRPVRGCRLARHQPHKGLPGMRTGSLGRSRAKSNR